MSGFLLVMSFAADSCGAAPEGKMISPSEEALILPLGRAPGRLPEFTNRVQQALKESGNRKEAASLLLVHLLAERAEEVPPPLAALAFLVSEGADVNYELKVSSNWVHNPLQAAAQRFHGLETVQWLVERGANLNQVSGPKKSTALDLAVSRGDVKLVRWMLEHGARVQEQKTDRSLLATAAKLEDQRISGGMQLIPTLFAAGADPYLGHKTKESVIDLLAERRNIFFLRLLDTKRVYGELIDRYTPPKDSPFVGIWSNDGEGFSEFGLTLNEEGLAFFGMSVGTMGFVPWRTVDATKAVIEITDNGKRQDLTVEWVAASNRLRLIDENGAAGDTLRKRRRQPPRAAEILKSLQE